MAAGIGSPPTWITAMISSGGPSVHRGLPAPPLLVTLHRVTDTFATRLGDPARLAALRATGLLDAPPQEALDRLTRLATSLLGVPIALVSLVDENRQRFVSQVGLHEPWASARETPLSHSFCQHVVSTRAALVIDDARLDPLVSDNLAIPELGVIAYAGMPLTGDDGQVFGSFCAIDVAPRKWTPEQLTVLGDLAHAASAELQLRIASRLLGSRQRFLSDLLDHTSELVCATGASGHMEYVNGAMVTACGHSPAALARMRPIDLVAAECRDAFKVATGTVRHGERVELLESVLVAGGGQRLHVRGSATPVIEEGAVTGARIIFRDVTREREAQRFKDELIALVSHELRTPVGAIRSALKILGPHVAHLEGKPRKLFDMAARNADALLGLVNDLLDIERTESGQASLQRVAVPASALLQQAHDALSPYVDSMEITLRVEDATGSVMADPARVQQVLVNLVGNAVKFSPVGSTITIEAVNVPALDGPAMMRFGVADQGRGIPADKLERIFERFEQVHSTDASEKGGAGLGLAVSKAIVEQHGGRIWAESVLGEGSRVYFTLPCVEEGG